MIHKLEMLKNSRFEYQEKEGTNWIRWDTYSKFQMYKDKALHLVIFKSDI